VTEGGMERSDSNTTAQYYTNNPFPRSLRPLPQSLRVRLPRDPDLSLLRLNRPVRNPSLRRYLGRNVIPGGCHLRAHHDEGWGGGATQGGCEGEVRAKCERQTESVACRQRHTRTALSIPNNNFSVPVSFAPHRGRAREPGQRRFR